ncbi:MAG: hypothetical protein AAFW81_09300 [Pseudomonadota bacterium]
MGLATGDDILMERVDDRVNVILARRILIFARNVVPFSIRAE